MPDIVIYCDRDGRQYIGCLDGDWFRWAAQQGGWLDRKALKAEPDVAGLVELDSQHADLALKLSGWERRGA